MLTSIYVIAALTAAASAKHCINATVPVNVQAINGIFDISVPQTNLDVTTFISNLAQQGRNYTASITSGYKSISKTYDISTQFCIPSHGLQSNTTVQVLTHGVGFDKTYWDIPYNNFNYSYVDAALNASYATLSFDRLGLGKSSHGHPLNEIQIFVEIAATAELTRMLRNGTFPGANHSFQKVVHVGHSFGSIQTYNLANMYPDLTDAIVLTGFSIDLSFIPTFIAAGSFVQANKFSHQRFGSGSQNPLPEGYLVSATPSADAFDFFLGGYYDPALLYASEETKQVVTVGEFLTVGSFPFTNQFSGPVMVFTGSNDQAFCGGLCQPHNSSLPSIPAGVVDAFPNVSPSNFTTYIQPNTGHGIPFHYNATAGYKVIQKFFANKGF
jgi:pimeloyl-ACP methyl ester carboxylesterase